MGLKKQMNPSYIDRYKALDKIKAWRMTAIQM